MLTLIILLLVFTQTFRAVSVPKPTYEFSIPSVRHRNDPSSVLRNVLKNGLRKIEVLLRWITPASFIVG